jgi:hypothetical protein
MKRRYPGWMLAALSMVVSVVLLTVLLEVALQFLPVASGLRSLPVTTDDPLLRYTPNREYVYSRDWNFNMVNRGRVNNAGFINDQDYAHEDAVPLLAVIGDSYIQAQMVPYDQTLHGRLAAAAQDNFRVYSFAASGAPLSQYLIYSRYAVTEWGAKTLVINVVGNDFDESHTNYKSMPGFWYYHPAADQSLQLQLAPLARGSFTPLAQRSALARYLFINLGLNNLGVGRLASGPTATFAGNTATSTDTARVQASLQVIETFLSDLKQIPGLAPERVLFTVDGFRYPDAARAGKGSYFEAMRSAFIATAQAGGFEVSDLDPRFFVAHETASERFEFPMDGHWNENGHRVAFEATMNSRVLSTWP